MHSVAKLQRFEFPRRSTHRDRAVRNLVRHAYETVPYFQNLLDRAGVSPASVQTERDLVCVPLTERETLASLLLTECTDSQIALERCFQKTTSGTSGVPLKFYMRQTELAYRRLTLGRVLLRAAPGLPPWRIVEMGRIFSRPRPITNRVPGLVTVVTPPGQDAPEEQLRWLRRVRPHIIEGFPTALEVFARACRKEGWSPPVPRVVISRGETLFADVRELLESVFSAPVVDHYNCEEIGNVAWQCPLHKQRMHINQDTCVVEIVDREGNRLPDGRAGSIALTNLYNYTMPFLRYQPGDRGQILPVESRCACGARGPVMALLDGREDDILQLPNGREISPRIVVSAMFCRSGVAIRGVHRYQLVQEMPDRLEVRVVLGEDPAPDWREALTSGAARVLEGVEIDIRQVDKIPLEPSGKLKRVVSALSRRRQHCP